MTDGAARPPRRGWLLRVLTWPVSLLLIVATVLVGNVIVENLPGTQEMFRPFVHSGPMGVELDAQALTATVVSVQGGQSVTTTRDGTYRTDALFLVVHVVLTARKAPANLAHASVVDRTGRVFEYSGRLRQGFNLRPLQPEIPTEGDLVFEVPRDSATGLVVRLSPDLIGRQHNQQRVIEVDLGIDQADVDRWLSGNQPVPTSDPEVKG